MKKTKWLIYTVLIGLIPFLIRTFIFLIDKKATYDFWLNAADFIVLGLVLNLTNINELEDKELENKQWKTKTIGLSVVFIALYAAILAILTYTEFKLIGDIDKGMVKYCSIGLAFASFLFSYAIFNRLNTIER